jgi:regulator of protease activity HflC (stomatin/prohibitin superfamily)
MNLSASVSLRLSQIALALVVALGSTACSYARVGSGEVAIVRTPDGVEKRVYPPGDWRIGVWDNAIKYSVRSQEREEQPQVLASNGLRIVLDTSVRFHIVPDEAVALDHELGENYYGVLIGPTLRSESRRVVGRFNPEEIYSTQRELIEREIREGIESHIKGRHVVLEAVLVRNVTLPDSIQQAINTKLEAEQSALKMKYVLEQSAAQEQDKLMQIKAQAERAKIQAESQADVARLQAQAAADSKRIDGKATAEYQQLVQAHLTPGILRLQEIEANKALAHSPNAKLVIMGSGGGHTLLDLRGVQGGQEGNPYP